jgi:hypothetical protein
MAVAGILHYDVRVTEHNGQLVVIWLNRRSLRNVPLPVAVVESDKPAKAIRDLQVATQRGTAARRGDTTNVPPRESS